MEWKWNGNETHLEPKMEPKWDRNGTGNGTEWNGNGTGMDPKRNRNGTQIERKRNQTEREWIQNGTQMERKWNGLDWKWNGTKVLKPVCEELRRRAVLQGGLRGGGGGVVGDEEDTFVSLLTRTRTLDLKFSTVVTRYDFITSEAS